MASSIQVQGDESVTLRVTHSNLKTFASDIRFSLQLTVEAVKDKLWRKCGTSVNSMHLELFDDARNKVADLSDNSKPLGFYSPLDGFRLHVLDLDPTSVSSGGWLEDTSLVEKYKISEEAYNKRQGIKYKEKFTSQIPTTAEAKVGSRCEVEPGAKRGVVKFVGQAEPLGPGFWVGVQYDEPLGKHDGMVKGVRYFECPPSHGGMLRPEKVKVCFESHCSNPLNIGIFSILRGATFF
uniref:Tubulin-specific chaperone B n=1 Tax=Cajanus cajan TaxID=3821 RepID=A0A151RRI4_CAJCA|nr:Tubulin-specific chaperone B [Cajanus cajan]